MKMNAQEFDALARSVFAPAYPVVAGQILAHTGITTGTCLDIGCGGGHLGAALGRQSALRICFFDQSAEMLDCARRTIAENGLKDRTTVLQGEVTAIGLPDGSVNLAVSRGSVFFWEDLVRAFGEIQRVLAPDGWAYIGGGFGTGEVRASIERQMAARHHGGEKFSDLVRKNLSPETRDRFETAAAAAGIDSFSIRHTPDIGLWLIMRKRS